MNITINKELKKMAILICVMAASFHLLISKDYGIVLNDGDSMSPTIKDGEWMIMEKRSLLGEGWTPDRFDIVLIKDRSGLISKRVLGLPSETLSLSGGKFYIDGRELESDVFNTIKPDFEIGPIKIPKGFVYVIGDSRAISVEGLFSVDSIVGRII